jgi:hypothetical protein
MFPSVLPLRAIAYQILFLLIAIAIEAWVLRRLLKTAPRQSIQYATTVNLLCTIVGWLAFFLFYAFTSALPSGATTRFDVNLIDFIFFDRWSSETATSLIFISFVMFFASFAIKQGGLSGLRWLLQTEPKSKKPQDASGDEVEVSVPTQPVIRRSALRVRAREAPSELKTTLQPQAKAVLFANAWSFSAILAILILRFVFQSTLNTLTP